MLRITLTASLQASMLLHGLLPVPCAYRNAAGSAPRSISQLWFRAFTLPAHVCPLLLRPVSEHLSGGLTHHDRIREKERVLLSAAIGGVLHLEIVQADRHVEYHALADACIALGIELQRTFAELKALGGAGGGEPIRILIRFERRRIETTRRHATWIATAAAAKQLKKRHFAR